MNNNNLFILLLLLVSICLSCCASPASKDAMIVHHIENIQHHRKTVAISTQGGNETVAIDIPNVSNNDFAKAIEESIIENGLFTQVIHGNGSDYLLNVTIINISKPLFGTNFTVDMEAAWSLSDPITKKFAIRETIKSSHTATSGEAFAAVTRLRLAIEGAVRENIQKGIMAISNLNTD